MNITPEELSKNGFVAADELEHQDLVPFIKTYLKKPTLSSRFYTSSNIIFFACLVANFIYQNQANGISIGTGLSYSSFGITIAFLLIPIHEYIHVLAYKYVGAKLTSYDVN